MQRQRADEDAPELSWSFSSARHLPHLPQRDSLIRPFPRPAVPVTAIGISSSTPSVGASDLDAQFDKQPGR
jgi:hypothetical protein